MNRAQVSRVAVVPPGDEIHREHGFIVLVVNGESGADGTGAIRFGAQREDSDDVNASEGAASLRRRNLKQVGLRAARMAASGTAIGLPRGKALHRQADIARFPYGTGFG